MNLNFTFRTVLLTVPTLILCLSLSRAQTCYTSGGCSDYSNFGYGSTTAATLEYDNYVSGFHQSAVRDVDGIFKVWGQRSKADGSGSWLVPTPVNPGNYPGLTGTPLKIAIGSDGVNNSQFILLTDDNKLWVWGTPGAVIDGSLLSGPEFQQLALGLPAGITAAQVKMMFASSLSLVITTCDGDVYILTQYWGNVGNGSTAGENIWVKVKKTGGADLNNIVAARGSRYAFIALDSTGNLWTWGYRTWDGSSPSIGHRNIATSMTLPSGASGNIKMIGVTGYAPSHTTYYVLYESGMLYAMGSNNYRQIGNWNTIDQATWTLPTYDAAGTLPMNNIAWISPNEHDGMYVNINVLNDEQEIWNWGLESGYDLGRGVNSSPGGAGIAVDPGQPIEFDMGYTNSNIIGLETGGHTTMVLRECDGNFGYIGHRILGSMGDNDSANETDNMVHFKTNAVQVCGGETVDATLDASLIGPYCTSNTVSLLGSPAGGTYSVDAGSTATAILVDSTVTFTGTGTLRVNYTIAAGTCGTVTVSKVFDVQNCGEIVTIPGVVWNDADGDAVTDPGEDSLSNGLWANLTDPDGHVIASVRVAEDGTYSFSVSTEHLNIPGGYSVVLTNSSRYQGDALSASDTLSGGFEYTGTNRGLTSIDAANHSGIQNIGDLSTILVSTTTDPVNFGIQRPPVADEKTFDVAPSAFSNVPPSGFPIVTGYQSLPMASPELGGYPTGGSLSGSDPEDCSVASSCNTGTGTTFNIESINSNTKIYYDFGAGPVMLDVAGGPVSIENFDVSKLVIYGENGGGAPGSEFGFIYTITDKAGAISDPVSYTIGTTTVLPVELLYFNVTKEGNKAVLSWATASEQNNRGFEIEHSAEGNAWTQISFVPSRSKDGNSTVGLEYFYADDAPLEGDNFYRLKQIAMNGSYVYSIVRKLSFTPHMNISFHPNPVKDNLTIEGLKGGELIKIYDMAGRTIRETKSLKASITIGLSDLDPGLYYVKVAAINGVTIFQKVVKVN